MHCNLAGISDVLAFETPNRSPCNGGSVASAGILKRSAALIVVNPPFIWPGGIPPGAETWLADSLVSCVKE